MMGNKEEIPDADAATSTAGQEQITTDTLNVPYPEFSFIDTASGGVTHRNNLIQFDELESSLGDWREKNMGKPRDCQATYFRYPDAILKHFNDDRGKKPNSVEHYRGPRYSGFIPLEFDSTDLKDSLQWTKTFPLSLEENYGGDLKTIPVCLSGVKGVHIKLPSQLFGLEQKYTNHPWFLGRWVRIPRTGKHICGRIEK
jgi:hypothetical protein